MVQQTCEKISIRRAKFAKIGLQDLINDIPNSENMIMVEIGSYVGDSTELFARGFKRVYAVDPWRNGYDKEDAASYQHDMKIVELQFDELLKIYHNLYKYKCTSHQATELFDDGSLDFVYIDGLHTYAGVKKDIETWLPKIKPCGYIGGHDYGNKHHPGVKPAVDEYFVIDKTYRDTSWLKKL